MATTLTRRLHWIVALACCGVVVGSLHATDGKPRADLRTSTTNDTEAVELTGRIVQAPNGTNAIAFEAKSGELYSLVRNQKAEALFVDTNLWPKTLLLKGRVRPATHLLEITGNLHSLRNGKRHELYYYCNICSIKTSEPGPCLCCREPVELVEEPE